MEYRTSYGIGPRRNDGGVDAGITIGKPITVLHSGEIFWSVHARIRRHVPHPDLVQIVRVKANVILDESACRKCKVFAVDKDVHDRDIFIFHPVHGHKNGVAERAVPHVKQGRAFKGAEFSGIRRQSVFNDEDAGAVARFILSAHAAQRLAQSPAHRFKRLVLFHAGLDGYAHNAADDKDQDGSEHSQLCCRLRVISEHLHSFTLKFAPDRSVSPGCRNRIAGIRSLCPVSADALDRLDLRGGIPRHRMDNVGIR
jgi:hypothetical protein